jgi:hypothetical protein
VHCAIAQAVASRAWLVSAITREARGENVGGLSFWHSRAERSNLADGRRTGAVLTLSPRGYCHVGMLPSFELGKRFLGRASI